MVVGSVNADLVLQVDRLPKEGETLGAHTLDTFPGGKAWGGPQLVSRRQGTHARPTALNTQARWHVCLWQGANQAAAAARLQHPTYFIGQVMHHPGGSCAPSGSGARSTA